MHSLRFFALLALVFVGAFAILTPDDLQYTSHEERQAFKVPPKCVTGIHMIAVPGLGVANHTLGLLSTTVEALREAIPNSSNFTVNYPRTSNYTQVLVAGERRLKANLKWYTAGCPDTQVVLLGYSDGAVISMNTLCGASVDGQTPYGAPLPSHYNQSIIASIMFGDESRVPNQSYDLGNCTTGQGIIPRGNPAGCAAFATYLQSYCNIGDSLCCGGADEGGHKEYPMLFNGAVVQYIQSRYSAN